jgi:hypothetical protein
MLCAMMLADWVFPFVYNIGFNGFASAMAGWFLLGGLVVLDRTRTVDPTPLDGDHYPGSGAEPELTSGSRTTLAGQAVTVPVADRTR